MSRRAWIISRRGGVCAGLAVLLVQPARAQQPNVDFTISGTSTVRSWTCSAKGVMAFTPGAGSAQPAPGFASGVQRATVTVSVKAFTCPNEEMTQHLLEAMKADKFSEIVYRLEKYEVTGGQAQGGGRQNETTTSAVEQPTGGQSAGGQAQATGTLTITGVTQPISFPIALKPSSQGVQVEGNTRLDMTKFGVDPPVVMLGLLKVGPQIRIEFKGVVAK